METNPTLQQIYNNLQDGRIYGYDFTKCKYPFFDPVLYGHTEDECENIRRRLLTLKKFEELEFCLMGSHVGYKYFKNSKWNAIYPVPNFKGELVYDNMSM